MAFMYCTRVFLVLPFVVLFFGFVSIPLWAMIDGEQYDPEAERSFVEDEIYYIMNFFLIFAWIYLAFVFLLFNINCWGWRVFKEPMRTLWKGFKQNQHLARKWSAIETEVKCVDCPICLLDF
jgi:hypothetical protein